MYCNTDCALYLKREFFHMHIIYNVRGDSVQIFIKLLIGILCVLGISEVIWNIILHFIRPKGGEKPVIIIRLCGSAEDVEQKLRSADYLTRLIGGNGCDGVIAIDCGIETEAKEIAARYCRPRENIEICSPDEFLSVIKKL